MLALSHMCVGAKKGNAIPREVRKLFYGPSQFSRKLLRSCEAAAIVTCQQRLVSIEEVLSDLLRNKNELKKIV